MPDNDKLMNDAKEEQAEIDAFLSVDRHVHEVDRWIDEHEKVWDPKTQKLKLPQKSNTRILMCEGLATMSNYRVLEGDNTEDMSSEMGLITPPSTHTWVSENRPAWGAKGKPTDWYRQLMRLVGAGLAEFIVADQVGDQPGRLIIGIVLTPAGIIYPYRHGQVTWEDVEDYWAYSQGWRDHPTTNIWKMGGAPHVANDFQFASKSYNSILLHGLRVKPDVLRRYSALSGDKLGRLVAASWAADPEAVYRLLEKPEREAVVKDLFARMDVPNSLADQLAEHTLKAGTIPQIIERLISTYEEAKPITLQGIKKVVDEEFGDSPKLRKGETVQQAGERLEDAIHSRAGRFHAEQTVAELFGRVGWVIAQRVMDYRTNDNSAQVLGRFGRDSTGTTSTSTWGDGVEKLKQLTEQVDQVRRQLEAAIKPAVDAQEYLQSAKSRTDARNKMLKQMQASRRGLEGRKPEQGAE